VDWLVKSKPIMFPYTRFFFLVISDKFGERPQATLSLKYFIDSPGKKAVYH